MAYFEPKGCRNRLFWEIIYFLIDLEKSLIKNTATNSDNVVIDKFKKYWFSIIYKKS